VNLRGAPDLVESDFNTASTSFVLLNPASKVGKYEAVSPANTRNYTLESPKNIQDIPGDGPRQQ
jgi:hypothetical protein